MPIGDIGELYNSDNVLVGAAVGFVSPLGTPDPADSLTVFDPGVWLVTKVSLGGATAGTFSLTLTGGPLATPATISSISFNTTIAALKALIDPVLPTNYTSKVAGAPGNYQISIVGPQGAAIAITGTGTLTGGAFTSTVSPWMSCGATEQGWQVNWNPSTTDIRIDEQPTPVDEQMDSATLQFVANLSEDTLAIWGLALNADKTIQAAGVGIYGKTILTPNANLKKYKVVLETQNQGATPRRFIVPKMTCAANVGAQFRRSGTQRLIPVTFTSVCKFTDIQVVDITTIPTG